MMCLAVPVVVIVVGVAGKARKNELEDQVAACLILQVIADRL
jgi:RNase H-fold protein (predicted Holliday junction resolvase)